MTKFLCLRLAFEPETFKYRTIFKLSPIISSIILPELGARLPFRLC